MGRKKIQVESDSSELTDSSDDKDSKPKPPKLPEQSVRVAVAGRRAPVAVKAPPQSKLVVERGLRSKSAPGNSSDCSSDDASTSWSHAKGSNERGPVAGRRSQQRPLSSMSHASSLLSDSEASSGGEGSPGKSIRQSLSRRRPHSRSLESAGSVASRPMSRMATTDFVSGAANFDDFLASLDRAVDAKNGGKPQPTMPNATSSAVLRGNAMQPPKTPSAVPYVARPHQEPPRHGRRATSTSGPTSSNGTASTALVQFILAGWLQIVCRKLRIPAKNFRVVSSMSMDASTNDVSSAEVLRRRQQLEDLERRKAVQKQPPQQPPHAQPGLRHPSSDSQPTPSAEALAITRGRRREQPSQPQPQQQPPSRATTEDRRSTLDRLRQERQPHGRAQGGSGPKPAPDFDVTQAAQWKDRLNQVLPEHTGDLPATGGPAHSTNGVGVKVGVVEAAPAKDEIARRERQHRQELEKMKKEMEERERREQVARAELERVREETLKAEAQRQAEQQLAREQQAREELARLNPGVLAELTEQEASRRENRLMNDMLAKLNNEKLERQRAENEQREEMSRLLAEKEAWLRQRREGKFGNLREDIIRLEKEEEEFRQSQLALAEQVATLRFQKEERERREKEKQMELERLQKEAQLQSSLEQRDKERLQMLLAEKETLSRMQSEEAKRVAAEAAELERLRQRQAELQAEDRKRLLELQQLQTLEAQQYQQTADELALLTAAKEKQTAEILAKRQEIERLRQETEDRIRSEALEVQRMQQEAEARHAAEMARFKGTLASTKAQEEEHRRQVLELERQAAEAAERGRRELEMAAKREAEYRREAEALQAKLALEEEEARREHNEMAAKLKEAEDAKRALAEQAAAELDKMVAQSDESLQAMREERLKKVEKNAEEREWLRRIHEAMANVEGRDDNKLPSIYSFTRHGKWKEVEEALNQGFFVDQGDFAGNTILITACQNGLKRLAKIALRWKASINLPNKRGQTALHFCYAYGYKELGDYLVTKGADVTAKNMFGLTPKQGLSPDDRAKDDG